MTLNVFVENRGKTSIFIFVLIDLKTEIKEGTVFAMRPKPHIQNGLLKRKILIAINVVCN